MVRGEVWARKHSRLKVPGSMDHLLYWKARGQIHLAISCTSLASLMHSCGQEMWISCAYNFWSQNGGWFKTSFESSWVSCIFSASRVFGVTHTDALWISCLSILPSLCSAHTVAALSVAAMTQRLLIHFVLLDMHCEFCQSHKLLDSLLHFIYPPYLFVFLLSWAELSNLKQHSKGTLQSLPLCLRLAVFGGHWKNFPELTEGPKVLNMDHSDRPLSGTEPRLTNYLFPSGFRRTGALEKLPLLDILRSSDCPGCRKYVMG